MAKITLQPGILFNIVGEPPTNIPRNEIKDQVVYAKQVAGNKISLSFTLEIENARIFETPQEFEEHELRRKGYLPFKPGTTNIDIKEIEQTQNQNQSQKEDAEATFTLIGHVPGGKIGGAGFRILQEDKINL